MWRQDTSVRALSPRGESCYHGPSFEGTTDATLGTERHTRGTPMSRTTPNAHGITRKAFLKGAMAGGAALVLGPRSLGAQPKPIKIGGQFCLTGGLAPYGIWGNRAVEAAIKKINAEGGIKGRKLEYVVEDTETNVQTGIRKMRKLIEGDEVDFVVG